MVSAAAVVVALALQPIPVRIQGEPGSFQLLRDGQPYFIKGAGGGTNFATLRRAGGNSVRTWGSDNLWGQLNEAHELGLTMTIGVWLGHKRHGFRYDDPKMLREQFERTRAAVREYRNHPALLLWALGNEMELDGDEDAIWKHIEELAQMVKKEDPNHPVMTVVAEINPEKIDRIKRLAPSLDLLGVNSYGGLRTLGQRLQDLGWTKPFVVTEHGYLGQWEAAKTSWGVPIEPTSTEKAKGYREMYEAGILGSRGRVLGSYVFLWGEKQEQTATWHGMFLRTGEALQTVETMAELWGGQPGPNLAPVIDKLELEGDLAHVKPGAILRASVDAKDPNGDPLRYDWLVQPEQDQLLKGGDDEKRLAEMRDAIQGSGPRVSVKAPMIPGAYRLFLYLHDGNGKAATGNIPFRIVAP
jgi:hypothetical protein